jgi:hypothetical protein
MEFKTIKMVYATIKGIEVMRALRSAKLLALAQRRVLPAARVMYLANTTGATQVIK